MKRRRILLWIAAGLLGASLLVGAWLLHTESGLRFIAARAQSAVPGLSIGQTSGTLGGIAQFDRIDFGNASTQFTTQRLRASLKLAPLLVGRIDLDTLDVDDFRLLLKKSGPPNGAAKAASTPSLPRIHVDRLTARGLRIDREGAEPMVWKTLDAAVDLAGSRISVNRTTLEHQDYALNGDIGIDLANAWLIDRAELALASSDASGNPLQAKLSRKPGATFDVQIAQPLQAMLQITPGKRAGEFRAKLSLPTQDASRFGLPADLPVLAELEFGRDASKIGVDASVELGPHRATVKGAQLQWLDSGLQIDALAIDIADTGTLLVSGMLPISDEKLLALTISSTALRFAAEGRPPLLVAGTLAATGSYSEMTIVPDLTVTQQDLPPGTVTGTVTVGKDALVFDALKLRLPRGALDVDGTLARTAGAPAELALRLTEFDPSMFAADWSGALSGEASWNGNWGENGIDGVLEIAHIDGQLRGQPFALNGTARVTANTLHDTDLEGRLGTAHAQLRGDISGPGPLSITFDAPELAALHPNAGGKLQLTAARDISWRIDASGEALKWDELSLGALSLSGSLGTGDDPEADLKASLGRIIAGELHIEQINLALAGRMSAHRLRVDLGSERGRIELAASGNWSQQRWDGVIEQFDLAVPGNRNLRLQQPFTLALDHGRVELSKACWAGSEQASLCAEGDYGGGNGRIAFDIGALPLSWLSSLTEDSGYTMQDAVLNGHAIAQWSAGRLVSASIHLTSEQGRLVLRDRADLLLGYRALLVQGEFDGTLGNVTISTELLPDGHADARFQLQRDASGAIGYDGNVTVLIRQLDAIEAFTTEIANPSGQINGQFRLQRDAQGSRIGGAVALSGFNAEVPSLGLSLKNGSVALAGVPEGLILRGAVQSGDGTLTVDGRWSDDAERRLTLTIKGENVRFSNTPELALTATPDLQLERDKSGWNLSGTVEIPRALIQADQISSNARESPDVVIVDDPPDATPSERWRARVTVRMGDDVQLKGFGFDGRLSGQLAVRQSNSRSATATGQLGVSGIYNAYGQKLSVARGELLYAGSPLDEPTVVVRAERKIGDSTAGSIGAGHYRRRHAGQEPGPGRTGCLLQFRTGGRGIHHRQIPFAASVRRLRHRPAHPRRGVHGALSDQRPYRCRGEYRRPPACRSQLPHRTLIKM
jgi:translocation and assembly module TamB